MNSTPDANSFLARGGAWVVIQFALMLAVIILGVVFRGDWKRNNLITNTGAGLLTLGGVFGISGVIALGRNRTAYPRPRADATLIQGGIYAHVRHPLYTSVMLVSLGWAVICQSWPALLAAVALIPSLAAKARREEAWLREKFPGYADYARRVPRFLPRFGRRPK
jgi:protein-S-isoprenylcysteine O-methyltransferase Ste14